MNYHVAFKNYLAGLPDGDHLVAAYEIYKNADEMFAYKLNGCLKGGHEVPGDVVAHAQYLKKIICARNSDAMTLFRMTSDTEFTGPLYSVIAGEAIRYPAFLSASRSKYVLGNFVPNSGNPLLLEICCPAGTIMALMEADGGLEDEYLLGASTSFKVVGHDEIHDPQEIEHIAGVLQDKRMLRVCLEVVSSPAYAVGGACFDFDPSVTSEDES